VALNDTIHSLVYWTSPAPPLAPSEANIHAVGDFSYERPVSRACTGDFHNVEAVVDNFLDGILVEGGAGGQEPNFPRMFDQFEVFGIRDPSFLKLLDVLEVSAFPVIRMNRRIQIAVLELDCGWEIHAA
jgi:hypothetical protein